MYKILKIFSLWTLQFDRAYFGQNKLLLYTHCYQSMDYHVKHVERKENKCFWVKVVIHAVVLQIEMFYNLRKFFFLRLILGP